MNANLSIESRYLPPILRDITELIGLPATLALVRHAGGTRLYVPVRFDPDHPLVKVLGHAAAVALIERHRGEYIDLPKRGHTNVRVWWERITAAMEMCGQGGGWMAETDQAGVEPLGLNYDRAVDHIETASWMTPNV